MTPEHQRLDAEVDQVEDFVHTPTLLEASEPFQICSQDLANCLQTQVAGLFASSFNNKEAAAIGDSSESFRKLR